jgi:hypothetical protein
MLEGFLGWHVVIIAAVVLAPVAILALAVVLLRRFGRD